MVTLEPITDTAEEGTSEGHLPMNPHGHGLVLSWIVSVHKLHRRVCPSYHNYRGFSAKKNMFLPDIIKDNSNSLEKTRGLDYMGLFKLLLIAEALSLCLLQPNYLSGKSQNPSQNGGYPNT